MDLPSNEPRQIVCTGEAGSDEWNPAFGTWEFDDFGMESDEPIGDGERLFVNRRLYDALEAENKKLRSVLSWYGEQARLAKLVHSEGDIGRQSLAVDGGRRAKAALNTDGEQSDDS